MLVSFLIRAPFYDRAVPELARHGYEVTVAYGGMSSEFERRGDGFRRPWGVRVPTLAAGSGPQPWAVRRWSLACAKPDLVIVQQATRNLETYPLLLRGHLGGSPVAMWGHGRTYGGSPNWASAALKQWMTRRCGWFFAYTQAGADHVVTHGFPRTRVSVLNNTIDTAALESDLGSVTEPELERFRKDHRLASGRTALFMGGVDALKGINLLLRMASEASRRMPGFALLIGGDGVKRAECEAAQRAGAPIRVLGRLDGREKAVALRAADVLAIPEWIGLVAVDSLVAGRPIVSTPNDTNCPEYEYLESGRTALIADASSPVGYARALVGLLDDGRRLADMQTACRAESRKYPMSGMVGSFVDGVLAWDETVRAGL